MLFGSSGPSEFFSQIHHRNAFTEKAWENAVASEKTGSCYKELLFFGNVFYKQCRTSLRVVSLVFRRHVLKIANINPQQEARSSLCKKLVPRDSGGNGA